LIPSVIRVNSSTISKYLRVERNYTSSSANRSSSGNSTSSLLKPGLCTAVIFYLEWCPFSAEAAPHFNALGRLFPQMRIIAIDAYSLYSATIRYGVVSVPSLYIFHNNKLVSKFNRSETRIDQLVEYIQSITTLEAIDEVALNESDFLGPLSNQVVHSFNYVLALSWIFVALVAIYYFARSDLFRKLKESVSNMWNEALFQHEHID
ncbi:Txndc15p, partial [Blomia tropicalis]